MGPHLSRALPFYNKRPFFFQNSPQSFRARRNVDVSPPLFRSGTVIQLVIPEQKLAPKNGLVYVLLDDGSVSLRLRPMSCRRRGGRLDAQRGCVGLPDRALSRGAACTSNIPPLDLAPTASLSGPSQTAPLQQNSNPASFTESDYQLGSGDKIRIIVFGENDLSGEFEVGAAGTIEMPLIGSVPARGRTVGQFQSDVMARLQNGYLKDPKVSVQVMNYRPFFITGEVQKTGEYPYKAGLTVQDAVGVAGGLYLSCQYRSRLYPASRQQSRSGCGLEPADFDQSRRQHPGA